MISLKQINKQKVKAIPIPDEDLRLIKGCDLCPELYANIFLCAKKKSGKTSAIFKIMKGCTIKKTIIYIFCSTIYKDRNWIEIRKHFQNKGMEINVFTSLYEDGEDQLQKLINQLSAEAQENEEEPQEEAPQLDRCDDILERLKGNYHVIKSNDDDEDEQGKPRKPRKSKHQAPEYMIIFDDLSSELKSRSLLDLLKKNRHYKTKLIISSQWVHDLLPESRKQIDLFLIFKGFPQKKVEEIYKDCDNSVPFETFLEVYKNATEKPFSFMYIDTRADKFRRNFDNEFIIT